MLNRRSFFKSVMVVGAGMLLPSGRSTNGFAVPATSTTSRLPGAATAIAEDVTHHDSDIDSLLELERCADLLDDLDCVEVIARFGPPLKTPRWTEAEPMREISHCPFCGEAGFHVGPESFTCKWCEAEGSAIEFYARAEGVLQMEAVSRLDALLKDGSLKGRRRENEHACRMLEETLRFYHELLCERLEGAMARQCLAEQGVTQSTIKRFRLGYSPTEPDDLLSRHLVAIGYHIPKLLQTLCMNEDGEQKMTDRYGGGNLLIPICDSAGRSWGFFKKKLIPRNNSMQAGWTQDTLSVSERRLRRLIFPHPTWPQEFNRYKTVLVGETPWEVVALHNAGIENAVYLFGCMADPLRMRTLCALGKDFVCSYDSKGYGPVTGCLLIEKVERESRQLRVMAVPPKGGVIKLLESAGSQAIRDAMSHAIPFHQWAGGMASEEAHHGMAVAAHFADRDPRRFAHAGDDE